MKDLNKIPKRNKNVAWRIIDNEAVIMISDRQTKEEKMNILNETGTDVWKLIDGKKSLKDMIKNVVREYYVNEKEATVQIKDVIKKMADKNLISFD